MHCDKINPNIARKFQLFLLQNMEKISGHTELSTRYLMSWEGFSGNYSSGYSNSNAVAENIRMATKNIDVKIIVYLRSQDDFIESLYTQEIHGGKSFAFQEFVSSLPSKSFNWEIFLASFEKQFGENNMIVRKYNKAFLPEPDSLFKDFYGLIGINYEELFSPEIPLTPNRGYSRNALKIARVCNPYLDSDEKKLLRKTLQSISAKQAFERYSFWSDLDRYKLLAEVEQSNNAVAKKYFPNDSLPLFPLEHCSIDHIDSYFLTPEKFLPILVKAIFQKQQTHQLPYSVKLLAKTEQTLFALLKKIKNIILSIWGILNNP